MNKDIDMRLAFPSSLSSNRNNLHPFLQQFFLFLHPLQNGRTLLTLCILYFPRLLVFSAKLRGADIYLCSCLLTLTFYLLMDRFFARLRKRPHRSPFIFSLADILVFLYSHLSIFSSAYIFACLCFYLWIFLSANFLTFLYSQLLIFLVVWIFVIYILNYLQVYSHRFILTCWLCALVSVQFFIPMVPGSSPTRDYTFSASFLKAHWKTSRLWQRYKMAGGEIKLKPLLDCLMLSHLTVDQAQ